jgi:hypothetical protein
MSAREERAGIGGGEKRRKGHMTTYRVLGSIALGVKVRTPDLGDVATDRVDIVG